MKHKIKGSQQQFGLPSDRFLLCRQFSQFFHVWTLRDLISGIKKKKNPNGIVTQLAIPKPVSTEGNCILNLFFTHRTGHLRRWQVAILPISLPCHPQPVDYTGCGCGQRQCLWHSVLPLHTQPWFCDLGCLCVSHYHPCSVLLGSGIS